MSEKNYTIKQLKEMIKIYKRGSGKCDPYSKLNKKDLYDRAVSLNLIKDTSNLLKIDDEDDEMPVKTFMKKIGNTKMVKNLNDFIKIVESKKYNSKEITNKKLSWLRRGRRLLDLIKNNPDNTEIDNAYNKLKDVYYRILVK